MATIECGNSGLLTNWLSESDLEKTHYQGGLLVRQPRQFEHLWKQQQLASLPEQTAEQLVATIAQQGLKELATDIVLVLGPEPTDPLWVHDDDRIHYGLAIQDQVFCKSSPFRGHPAILQARSAKQALDHLRLTLLSLANAASE